MPGNRGERVKTPADGGWLSPFPKRSPFCPARSVPIEVSAPKPPLLGRAPVAEIVTLRGS